MKEFIFVVQIMEVNKTKLKITDFFKINYKEENINSLKYILAT